MRASLAVESTMNGRRMRMSSIEADEAAVADGESEGPDCEAASSGFTSTDSLGTRWRLRAIRRLRPMCYTCAKRETKWKSGNNINE